MLSEGFSDGTLDSATTFTTQGGACLSVPPLRLTVSVSPSELILGLLNKVHTIIKCNYLSIVS